MKKTYVKTPTVYQMEAAECGAASLAMILAYFGCRVPLEKLRSETGVSRDGCRAGNIIRTAKRYGLNCCGGNYEIEKLPELSIPCIIHWGFNHFVVYEGVKGKKFYINDPASGRRALSAKEFDENFTGVAITFSPGEDFRKTKKVTGTFEFNGGFGVIVHSALTGILTAVPATALPLLTQFIFDSISGSRQTFNMILFLFIASALLYAVLSLYKNLMLTKLQKHISLVFGCKFLKKMLSLPMEFFDQRYASDVSGRLDSVRNAAEFLTGRFCGFVFNVFTALVYFAFMTVYSPAVSAAFAAGTVVFLLLDKLITSAASLSALEIDREKASLTAKLCIAVKNIKTLRSSNAEHEYLNTLLGIESNIRAAEQPVGKMMSISAAVKDTVFLIMMTMILLSGSMLILGGKFTLGMAVTYSVLFVSFISAVSNAAYALRGIDRIRAEFCRIKDIENYNTKPDAPKRADIVSKLSGAAELKNVSFGYSVHEKPVIENISIKLKPGSIAAITGDSGSGKSTVSKLFCGLYEPWSGEVLLDGIPLPEIPREILCASVSFVSQKITLFSGTIKNNITLWNENIRDNDIISAAKDACIHDAVISKPEAYDYVLKENGSNLSSGQRQCLEIARALAVNPSVLIMDEATSALDPFTEKKIIDNIKRRGCTCIMITHRLSAIQNCDEIIVIENGTSVRRPNRNGSGKTDPDHIGSEQEDNHAG